MRCKISIEGSDEITQQCALYVLFQRYEVVRSATRQIAKRAKRVGHCAIVRTLALVAHLSPLAQPEPSYPAKAQARLL